LKGKLPLPVHELLSKQAAHIQASHAFVREARNKSK
jgi:hypothetical protein